MSTEQPMRTVGQAIVDQFSLMDVWNRLGRVVTVLLGALQILGRPPHAFMEWLGICTAVAGAIWTSHSREDKTP